MFFIALVWKNGVEVDVQCADTPKTMLLRAFEMAKVLIMNAVYVAQQLISGSVSYAVTLDADGTTQPMPSLIMKLQVIPMPWMS